VVAVVGEQIGVVFQVSTQRLKETPGVHAILAVVVQPFVQVAPLVGRDALA